MYQFLVASNERGLYESIKIAAEAASYLTGTTTSEYTIVPKSRPTTPSGGALISFIGP